MRCPFCDHADTQVKDSRPVEEGAAIRRRRFCPECHSRFTTFERVQLQELTVIKRGGERKIFERDKIQRSMLIALRKRDYNKTELDRHLNSIVKRLETSGESEVSSSTIGKLIMQSLRELDQVAYIRYASVYRDFEEASDFGDFIDELGQNQ